MALYNIAITLIEIKKGDQTAKVVRRSDYNSHLLVTR